MAILDRSSRTTQATPRKTAPTLTHEQLRCLPIGYDDERSPFYVAADDREAYVGVASNTDRMRGWRDSASWSAQSVEVDPVTRQRVARSVDPDLVVHGWVLEEVRRGRAAQARAAVLAAERVEGSRCSVCHEAGLPDTPTTLYTITGGDVLLPAYGVYGTSVLLHEPCAAALRHALAARLPESTRQLAAAYAATL